MAEAIITRFRPGVKRPHPVERLELVPSGGGVFEVRADGKLVFSKQQVGRHAEIEEVLKSIAVLLNS